MGTTMPPAISTSRYDEEIDYPLDFAFKGGWKAILESVDGPLKHADAKPMDRAAKREDLLHPARIQLTRLRQILMGDPAEMEWDQPQARFAPSAMVRSENEIFGVDGPRFATRVYLGDAGGSFANVRRFGEFAQRLQGTRFVSLEVKDVGHEYEPLADAPEVSRIFETDRGKIRYIADALLVPPEHLSSAYRVLTVDLGREYGEGRSIFGTPFAVPLAGIGGGKCAQAAIFMASALLLGMTQQFPGEWPRICVHGPGEVTAIVSMHRKKRALRLRGLRASQIQTYFQSTERTCLVQLNRYSRVSFTTRCDHQAVFETAVRAYLRSGVPIILPVDARRPSNGQTLQEDGGPAHNHAVVIVGYSKDAEFGAPCSYLINNPGGFPFERWSAEKLWTASQNDESIEDDDVGRTICVPLPRKVRFSIESLIVSAEHDTKRTATDHRAGLIDLAMLLQIESPANPQRKVPYRLEPLDGRKAFRVGEIALIRLTPDSYKTLLQSQLIQASDAEFASLESCWNDLVKRWPDRWCYVQYRDSSFGDDGGEAMWIWDAERECQIVDWVYSLDATSLLESAQSHVITVFEADADRQWHDQMPDHAMPEGERLEASNERMNRTRASPASAQPLTSNLSLAVITSISANSSCEAIRKLDRRFQGKSMKIDLFSFMHRDPILYKLLTRHERRRSIRSRRPEAVEMMSRAVDDNEALDRVVHQILHVCQTQRVCMAPEICAISTFLPEISARDNDRRRGSVRAAAFCVRLAYALRDRGQPVRAIELVCGNRLGGLGRAFQRPDRKKHVFFAVKRDDDDLLECLKKSLVELVGMTPLRQFVAGGSPPCPVALELEPGPLNLLNHVDDLVRVGEFLRGSPAFTTCGFNLDIAHFHLSGASPEMLEGSKYEELVTNRIVSAHISDHGPGVFGDVSLHRQCFAPEKTGTLWLRQWLAFLDRLCRKRGPDSSHPGLRFSGTVSLELEAVRSMRMVQESFDAFHHWKEG